MSLRRFALLGAGLVAASALSLELFASPVGAAPPVSAPAPDLFASDTSLEKQLELTRREAKRVHQRLVTRSRLYTRQLAVGWLPIAGGTDNLWQHLSAVERLKHALHLDLRLERELAQRTSDLTLQLKERRTNGTGDEDPAFYEQERAAAFRRAFQSSRAPTKHAAVYAALGPPDAHEQAAGFRGMRGHLPFPVVGRTEITHLKVAGAGPGLLLRTDENAVVRAIFPGRVAFADQYGDYGKSVILEHGDGFYTVSAGLGRLRVSVGDEVTTGDVVGTAAELAPPIAAKSVSSEFGSSVYFEVRKGAEAVEPGPWFGI